MAITEETYIDSVEVLPEGQIQVREVTQLFEDGVPLGRPKFHRYVMDPDRDTVADVQAKVAGKVKNIDPHTIAQAEWTSEKVAARKAFAQEQRDRAPGAPPPTPQDKDEIEVVAKYMDDGTIFKKRTRVIVVDGEETRVKLKPEITTPTKE